MPCHATSAQMRPLIRAHQSRQSAYSLFIFFFAYVDVVCALLGHVHKSPAAKKSSAPDRLTRNVYKMFMHRDILSQQTTTVFSPRRSRCGLLRSDANTQCDMVAQGVWKGFKTRRELFHLDGMFSSYFQDIRCNHNSCCKIKYYKEGHFEVWPQKRQST